MTPVRLFLSRFFVYFRGVPGRKRKIGFWRNDPPAASGELFVDHFDEQLDRTVARIETVKDVTGVIRN